MRVFAWRALGAAHKAVVTRTVAAVCAVAALALLAGLPASAAAQRWREIGTTNDGNKVYVNPASVVKTDSLVRAVVRVVYTTPKPTPKGPINGSRADATFNCLRRTVAVKETIIWHDEAKGTIYEKRTPRLPGYGPIFNSNFSGVAWRHLCEPPAAAPATAPRARSGGTAPAARPPSR